MKGRNGNTDIKNGLVNLVGEEESGINGESSTDLYTLPYVKQAARKKLLYNTQDPRLHSVMNLRGSLGGEEGGLRERLYMYNYA